MKYVVLCVRRVHVRSKEHNAVMLCGPYASIGAESHMLANTSLTNPVRATVSPNILCLLWWKAPALHSARPLRGAHHVGTCGVGLLQPHVHRHCLKRYVCVLYGSPCAPLLLPWLGEVEGTSQAIAQAKASPVPALAPMFRVSPVLRRLPTAVPPTAVGACVGRL